MKSFVVLSLILVFALTGYFADMLVKRIFRPRKHFLGFLGYVLMMLILVFILTFLMVLLIGRMYPDELMK